MHRLCLSELASDVGTERHDREGKAILLMVLTDHELVLAQDLLDILTDRDQDWTTRSTAAWCLVSDSDTELTQGVERGLGDALAQLQFLEDNIWTITKLAAILD